MKRIILFLVLLAPVAALAQPRLDLRLLRPNSPSYYYYQLYFSAHCSDTLLYDLDETQLILEERFGTVGRDVYAIDRRPTPDRDACYDVALVFDNSSSISPATLTHMIDAGRIFIDSMTRDCQNTSIISVADRTTLHTFLSNDREISKQALKEMQAGGKRVLYDGIYTGLLEIKTNGRQGVASVVAITNGADNGSTTPVASLRETALNTRVRIFVFGLGIATPDQNLQTLCRETGGLYHSVVDEDSLLRILADFEGFIQREYDEYRIVRRTAQLDMRNMLIRLRLEACEDSVWEQREFMFGDLVNVESEYGGPYGFSLGNCYPNPVSTLQVLNIPFHTDVPEGNSTGLLHVFDALGRSMATQSITGFDVGWNLARFNPTSLSSGVYHFRVIMGNDVRGGTFTVLR